MKSILPVLILLLITSHTAYSQQFSDVAQGSGINHTFGLGSFGGGVSFADFNNDGWDDLSFASQDGSELSFYENIGGTFNKIIPSFVNNTDQVKQILWVDFNNDGYKDLFVSSLNAGNYLYINNGDFTFTDSIEFPPPAPYSIGPTYGAAFGDYDVDGDLDLFICNKTVHLDIPNQLFENNGDGTFTDITDQFFFNNLYQATFCAAFVDYNADGLPDIFTAEDKVSVNQVYKNLGGGVYQDITTTSGAGIVIDAMCVAVGDYDHDEDVDIYVTNTPGGNALLRNDGSDLFTEVGGPAGVGFYSTGWASTFFDYDNDTDLDLYVSGSTGLDALKSILYVNDGTGQYTQPSGIGFQGDSTRSFSHAVGDIDNDGYYDIAVSNNFPDSCQLWKNSGGSNNWIKVQLEGTVSNRDGIGTWIEVYAQSEKYIRYTHCGIGYLGQNSNNEIIGLKQEVLIDSILVKWTSGIVDKFYQVPVNQKLIVVEGGSLTDVYDLDPVEFNLYPNPVQSNFRIHVSDGSNTVWLEILSASGEQLLSIKDFNPADTIAIDHLGQGLYFVKLTNTRGETGIRKLMIY